MYSFSPITDTSDVHTGFYVIFIMCFIFISTVIHDMKEENKITKAHFIIIFFLMCLAGITHYASYQPDHPQNEKVVATFVGYQPEGYRESNGKTRSDHHYMYVVYSINGQEVILQGSEGIIYPKQVWLYKN